MTIKRNHRLSGVRSRVLGVRCLVVVVACMVWGHGTVLAQHDAGDWTFTPKVGVNLSKFTNDYILADMTAGGAEKIGASYKEGLSAGVDVEYFLHEHFALSAGLYYMNMGSRFKEFKQETATEGWGFSDMRTTMNFVQLPVMAGLYLENGLGLKVGVQMGRLMNSKHKAVQESWTIDEEGNREHASSMKVEGDFVNEWKQKFYFGLPVAISYEYQNVVIEARYIKSLTHPLKAAVYDDSHHSTFVFSVGYRLTN